MWDVSAMQHVFFVLFCSYVLCLIVVGVFQLGTSSILSAKTMK